MHPQRDPREADEERQRQGEYDGRPARRNRDPAAPRDDRKQPVAHGAVQGVARREAEARYMDKRWSHGGRGRATDSFTTWVTSDAAMSVPAMISARRADQN